MPSRLRGCAKTNTHAASRLLTPEGPARSFQDSTLKLNIIPLSWCSAMWQ
jgi:hypothetical protein